MSFGILRLRQIVRDYRGPLRADFRREYSIDLDDALSPDSGAYIRPQVMLDLIDGLSPQAAYWRAVDPDKAPWGLSELLLATLINDVRQIAHGFSGGKGKGPDLIPIPGKESPEDTAILKPSRAFGSIEEFEAWYQKIKEDRGN